MERKVIIYLNQLYNIFKVFLLYKKSLININDQPIIDNNN